MEKLVTFLRRMNKLGYKLKLEFNFPWIYLSSINGKEIYEKQFSEHCWTICLYPMNKKEINFINLSETIKLIRKYGKDKRIT